MTPSQISQWLLKHDAPFTDADKNALALLSKTYPYFVPSRYIEASVYNAEHPFAPAILNKMRLYMGDWISFHEFLRESKPETNEKSKIAVQTDFEEYKDDEPEYFFDTYEDEQEILKAEDQHMAETIYEDEDFEEEEEDFELFNEKDSEEEPFAAFDSRKEKPKIPEITVQPKAAEKPVEETPVNSEKTPEPAEGKTEPVVAVPEPQEKIKPEVPEAAFVTEQPLVERPDVPVIQEQAEKIEEVKEKEEPEDLMPSPKEEEEITEVVAIEEPPAVVKEIVQEETAPQIEIVPQEEKKSAKIKSEPLIQPIYTEDYFLHQGIDAETTEVENEKEKQLMVMMSFSDWLMHFKTKKEKQKEEEEDQKALKTMWQKEKLAAALEEENEEIPEGVFEMAVNSIKNEDDLVSESLAEIMIKQGKFDKAIEMYRKLSLRNPQKNAYFADKIEKLIKEK